MTHFGSFLWIALIANLFFAVANIIGKNILANKLQDVMTFFYLQASTAVPIFLIATLIFEDINVTFELLIISASSAIFVSIGYFFFYYGLRFEDVSVAGSITSSTRIPMAFILGFILFGEFYGLEVMFLMGMIFLGALLTSISEELPIRSLFSLRNRAAIIFIAAALFWALTNAVLRAGRASIAPFTLILFRQVFIVLILLVTYPFLFKFLGGDPNSFRQRKQLIIASKWVFLYNLVLIVALGAFIYALGFSLSLVESISPMEGVFSIILAVIFSYIRKEVVQESHSLKIYAVRIFGMFIVVFSVGMLLIYEPLE